MSEHDYILDNADGATYRADNNSALGAIATNNSKSSAPSTTFAHMWWADTTNNIIKQRNAANTAWINRWDFDTLSVPATFTVNDGDIRAIRESGQVTGRLDQYSDDTTSGVYMMRKSRGSIGSEAAVQSGDLLGDLNFRGHNGSAFSGTTARIIAVADENWSGSAYGCHLRFYTVDNTTTTSDERMRIDHNGNVGIGTTSPDASALLDITSTTKGFLLPRMTPTQREAISSPPAGLVVWDNVNDHLNWYDGGAWRKPGAIAAADAP